jgi:hypothetical protein
MRLNDTENGNKSDDWLDDETMTAEETIEKFEKLKPEPSDTQPRK